MDKATKIAAQFIFRDSANKFQILYECYGRDTPIYFVTSNGAFGQRDTYIESICVNDALMITKDLTLV